MIRSFLFSLFFPLVFLAAYPSVSVFSSADAVGEAAATKIACFIAQKKGSRGAVLGLATGSTMIPVYAALKKIAKETDLDLSEVVAFNLDEYLGLPSSHPQSYRSFMFEHLYGDLLFSPENPRGIKMENIYIPNGAALSIGDLSDEEAASLINRFPHRMGSLSDEEKIWIAEKRASEYDALILEKGPIDLQLLGIGRNGHIGFAEPGTPFDSRTQIVKLTENTRRDNSRFFAPMEQFPENAVTMGIGTILDAKEILLLATGEHKAAIIEKTLAAPISAEIPSTALRTHKNVSFFLDEPASFRLQSPILRFFGARLLLNHRIEEGELWVQRGKIIPPQAQADREIDLEGKILAPGYIDVQINGGFGCDFSRNPEMTEFVAKQLLQYGVTSFLPTVISSSPEQYKAVLPLLQPRSFGKKGASILGIHLEGPFFSPSCCGAHKKEFLLSDLSYMNSPETIYGDLRGVKLVTLAPELPGALPIVEQLTRRNVVVSAGHSAASFEQMKAGIKAGIGLATHLFNAMTPYHHRNPGIIGSALIDPSLPYSLIVDGVHLSPESVLLCWRCNPNGLILISDATEALGLPDGNYRLGTLEIESCGGQIYLSGTRTIAGSSLDLAKAVQNFQSITRCSAADALEAASLKPARLIGIYPSKGTLETGADADFIVLSDDLQVQSTYIGGELAWSRTCDNVE